MWFSELNKWMGWQGWLWDRHTLWASYPTEGTSLCHVVWCSVILAKWGQWNNFHWWPWAETEREAPEVKHHLSQQPFPEQPGQNSLCGGRRHGPACPGWSVGAEMPGAQGWSRDGRVQQLRGQGQRAIPASERLTGMSKGTTDGDRQTEEHQETRKILVSIIGSDLSIAEVQLLSSLL